LLIRALPTNIVNIGKSRFHLPARPLLSQHNPTLPIVADDMKRVPTDIYTDHGNRAHGLLASEVLLGSGAPCQLQTLAGQEHDRTISLPEVEPR
jgi:hypothetical protein